MAVKSIKWVLRSHKSRSRQGPSLWNTVIWHTSRTVNCRTVHRSDYLFWDLLVWQLGWKAIIECSCVNFWPIIQEELFLQSPRTKSTKKKYEFLDFAGKGCKHFQKSFHNWSLNLKKWPQTNPWKVKCGWRSILSFNEHLNKKLKTFWAGESEG